MDVARFQAGDPAALAAAVDVALPGVWRLVRQGFTTTVDGHDVLVRGAESASEAEVTAARVLGDVLAPLRRATLASEADLLRAALEAARDTVMAAAQARGRVVSLLTPEAKAAVPAHVRSVERVLAGAERLDEDAPLDVAAMERLAKGRAAAAGAVATLEDELRRIAERRFVAGEGVETIAAELGKGRAFVRGRERRLRRTVRRALRTALPGEPSGDAELDLALAPEAKTDVVPAVTRERLRRRVLTRVFPSEPRPYGERLAWALGAAGLALALLVLELLTAKPR